MDDATTKDSAIQWGISDRRVRQDCNVGEFEGADKRRTTWRVPKNAKEPEDGDYKK